MWYSYDNTTQDVSPGIHPGYGQVCVRVMRPVARPHGVPRHRARATGFCYCRAASCLDDFTSSQRARKRARTLTTRRRSQQAEWSLAYSPLFRSCAFFRRTATKNLRRLCCVNQFLFIIFFFFFFDLINIEQFVFSVVSIFPVIESEIVSENVSR